VAGSTAAAGRGTATTGATRPRNRKAQILTAASRAFADRGYHAVGMEDIAAEVGISGPALYRHFPGKYALFAQCARSLAQGLLDAWPPAPVGADLTDPVVARDHLEAVLAGLVRTTVRNRRTGGIYRWEGRYLAPGDREDVRALFEEMIRRVTTLLQVLRPADPAPDLDLAGAGALSVVASITAHRTALPLTRVQDVIGPAALRVALAPLPTAEEEGGVTDAAPTATPRTRREAVLDAAVRLFHSVGFAEVTIEAIAAEAGLTPSGFYRHYASKADVLLAACLLAAEHLDAAVDAAGVRGVAPGPALERLSRAYVAHSMAHRALMQVYYSDVGSLPARDQSRLRSLQRKHVDLWRTLLRGARPELDDAEATFLVHAALGLVTDLGRRLQWRDSPATRDRLHAAVRTTLAIA
jgi:AcrR family transcriptional regulator